MKKNILITTLVVGALGASQFSLAATGSSGNCFPRRIEAMQKMANGASDVFDNTIKSPDTNLVDKCIGAIKQPRFGFGGSFPSIDDILSKVCNMVRSKIDQTISGLDYSFDMNGFGNGFGSGSNSYQFPINDFMGQAESPYSSNSLYSGSSSTQDYNNFPNSGQPPENTNYMNQAVSNAMNYLTGGK